MKEKISLLKIKLYCFIVNQNPYVKDAYQLPIDLDKEYHQKHRMLEWIRLIGLLIRYRIMDIKPTDEKLAEWEEMRNKKTQMEMAVMESKSESDELTENAAVRLRRTVDAAINELKGADLIRFSDRENILIWDDRMDNHVLSFVRNVVRASDTFRREYRFVLLKNALGESKVQEFPMFCFPRFFMEETFTEEDDVLTDDENRTLSRYMFLQQAVNMLIKKNPEIYLEYADLIVVEIYRYFLAALEYIKPELILFWSDLTEFNIIFRSICNEAEIPCAQVSYDYFSYAYCFNSTQSPQNNMLIRYPGWTAWVNEPTMEEIREADKIIEKLKVKKARNQRKVDNLISKIDFSRPLVFVCGQDDTLEEIVPEDLKTKGHHSPIFSSTKDALSFVSQLSQINKWNLLYKSCSNVGCDPEKYEKGLPSNVINVSEYDIEMFIDMCDVFVVLNNEFSYIALIRKKPVVLLGESSISGQGCCYEAYSTMETEDVIKDAIEQGMTDSQYSQFLRYIVCLGKYYFYCETTNTLCGQPIEKAIDYLETLMENNASF